MKQTIKNFGKALLGLVMPIKHQPLSDGWIKQNDKEIKKSVKSSAFRPNWMKFLNTEIKNEFKTANDFHNVMNDLSKIMPIDKNKLTTEQKLKQALTDLGSQPGYGKWEKSTDGFIKCDGTGKICFSEDIYYYAKRDLHLSKYFFQEVTKEQLQNDFDIDGDDDFRAWVADKLLKVREF